MMTEKALNTFPNKNIKNKHVTGTTTFDGLK
jgi:hypothetical protein